jgi:hypothetical protein
LSLRLAEAFIRTAVPEGHEPLRSLEDLRGHMYGTHNWDVAYMLPQRVLLHLHDKEHAEPEWHGSPDASRSPGFTAVFRHAQDFSEPAEGDSISIREQHRRLRAMREHMKGLGFSVLGGEERYPDEALAPLIRLDTGHHIGIGHSRRTQEWKANIHHPDDNGPHKTMVSLNLGVNPEHVVPLLTREIGSQPVGGEMMAQWHRAQGGPADMAGRRRLLPFTVHFTARGAQLPEDGGEEDY